MQPQDNNGLLPRPVDPQAPAAQTPATPLPTNDYQPPAQQPPLFSQDSQDHPDHPDRPDVSSTQHLGADDLDLIEKEWVMKAKEVVDHTQNDPYLQSKELSKIRADYIKKRYNRTIKPNE